MDMLAEIQMFRPSVGTQAHTYVMSISLLKSQIKFHLKKLDLSCAQVSLCLTLLFIGVLTKVISK